MHEFGRWDSFLFGSFHAICLLLTLTAPSYRGSPPIQETNLDPFFTHLQYCGRHESETVKAKLPWYRHIVPIHSQQQVGWIPRLIRYFIPWAINHFVVQWWWCRQNSGSIIGWGWESCHKQCPWAEHSLVRLIKVLLQRCPPSPTSTWAQRTNLDSNSISSLQKLDILFYPIH